MFTSLMAAAATLRHNEGCPPPQLPPRGRPRSLGTALPHGPNTATGGGIAGGMTRTTTTPALASVLAPTAAATMAIGRRPFAQEVEDCGDEPRVALQELERLCRGGGPPATTTG